MTESASGVPTTLADTLADRDRTIARLERDLAALRDILLDYMSAREAAEDEVRASEDRYRALIHRAAYGIFRATLDGRFIEVNPALVRTLGHPDAASLLATAADAVYYDPADHQRTIAPVLRGEGPGWAEVRWRRRDGAPVLIRLTLQAVHNGDGAAVALEGMTEDITDRSRQEELVRRSERMSSLGHMLAGVAHELNNPLAAIGGFAQLLLRETLSEEDRLALETINHEAQRAARIVRDLLAFSRRNENERRERVDLNDVVRYIVDAQRYQIETQGIRREIALAPALPPVLAQASQLEQVVLNLVVNARQALEHTMDERLNARRSGAVIAPPLISIRTAAGDGIVVLEVQDNGPGIPDDHRARIWDPFWTTKEEGEGTGLGLAVVHGIVSTYGGTIDVETTVGVGTRFIVKLPVAGSADGDDDPAASNVPDMGTAILHPRSSGETGAADPSPAAVTSPVRAPRVARAATRLRILVVDDETAILDLLARYFTTRGHEVVTTPNGTQAIEFARQNAFDVVICDLRMPALDGAAVIRQLRALPTCQKTRFIVSTGDSTALPNDLAAAAPTILVKPYDIDALRRTVEEPAVRHGN